MNAGADLLRVPSSKEDVFKNRELGLADKRKLMKFLMFAAGDYQNDEKAFQGERQSQYMTRRSEMLHWEASRSWPFAAERETRWLA